METIKPKIFFIADKWTGGEKNLGTADWENGMQSSLQSTGLADADVFHFDEYFLTTGLTGDNAVLEKIASYKPDMIYLITNKMPGLSPKVPQISTLQTIKNDLKIPLVTLFGDLGVPEQVKISLAILPYITLVVATELTAALERIGRPDKYIYMWVPKDPRIFNNPNKERDIDIGYVGSSRKWRHKVIMHLLNNGLKVVHGGRENGGHLSTEDFVDRYQRSKIALSFSRVRSSHTILARPFEAIACGAMLLEQESFEVMKLYTPYVDYVPYTSKRDLLKKAKYYLAHDEERERIARSGQKKTESLYSAKRFWQIVIDRALGNKPEEVYKFGYSIPQESLSKLSPFTAFKMKFLNSLCRTNAGFVVYKVFNWRWWQETFGGIWHNIFFVPIGKIKPFIQKRMSKKTFEFVIKIKRKIIRTH